MVESLTFTTEDETNALKKLRSAAVEYAADSSSFVEPLKEFKGIVLSPASFRDSFNRIFMIRFTLPEVGAMLHYLEPSGNSIVDGHTFLKAFFKLGALLVLALCLDSDWMSVVARVEERVLLQEVKDKEVTLELLRPGAILPGGNTSSPQNKAANKGSIVYTGTNRSGNRAKSPPGRSKPPVSQELDERGFSKSTISHKWILPQVAGAAASPSPERYSHGTSSYELDPSAESDDDFKPFSKETMHKQMAKKQERAAMAKTAPAATRGVQETDESEKPIDEKPKEAKVGKKDRRLFPIGSAPTLFIPAMHGGNGSNAVVVSPSRGGVGGIASPTTEGGTSTDGATLDTSTVHPISQDDFLPLMEIMSRPTSQVISTNKKPAAGRSSASTNRQPATASITKEKSAPATLQSFLEDIATHGRYSTTIEGASAIKKSKGSVSEKKTTKMKGGFLFPALIQPVTLSKTLDSSAFMDRDVGSSLNEIAPLMDDPLA